MKTTNNFFKFHKANPHVYKNLVLLARQYRDRHGSSAKAGIAMFWEKLRWDFRMSTTHDEFKLNNTYRAPYARLIMSAEDDLDGVFETRRSPHENNR